MGDVGVRRDGKGIPEPAGQVGRWHFGKRRPSGAYHEEQQPGLTRAALDALVSKMPTAFSASPTASVQQRVLGVEEQIRGTLVEDVPDLLGRVDLLTEDSDSLAMRSRYRGCETPTT